MTEIKFTYAHAAIMVSNIERAEAFYENAVGWKRDFVAELDGSLGEGNGFSGPGRISMGKLGGVPLEFVELKAPNVTFRPKQRPDHYGIFMCSVKVDDLAPMRARLRDKNIPVAREVDYGPTRLLVVTDPDGQEIGILGPKD